MKKNNDKKIAIILAISLAFSGSMGFAKTEETSKSNDDKSKVNLFIFCRLESCSAQMYYL